MGLSYPPNWSKVEPSSREAEQGVIAKARHQGCGALVLIRRIDKPLAKNFDIKTLPSELLKKFTERLVGFEPLQTRITKLAGYSAVELSYRQFNSSRAKLYQNLMLIMPLPQQTYHLVFRAPASKFRLIKNDIPKIVAAFTTLT